MSGEGRVPAGLIGKRVPRNAYGKTDVKGIRCGSLAS